MPSFTEQTLLARLSRANEALRTKINVILAENDSICCLMKHVIDIRF